MPKKRRDSEGSDDLLDIAHSSAAGWGGGDNDSRRMSYAASILNTPQVRSQRLIGSTNPRYKWEQYWKSDEQLKQIKSKATRKYYERNNYLIQNYLYIDRLLDSSLPHDLIQEYSQSPAIRSAVKKGSWQKDLPETIDENADEDGATTPQIYHERAGSQDSIFDDGDFYTNNYPAPQKINRTKDLYNVKKPNTNHENGESEPLLSPSTSPEPDLEAHEMPPDLELEEEAGSQSRIVTVAIVVNLIANTALLVLKIIVVILSSSVSVLASLVDAALDFLSTMIVGITTRLISRTDQYAYPIGRRRLEPVGVLVFSVIMITAFIQVMWEAASSLTNGDHEPVHLSNSAIAIMASTVLIKGACWLWCRLIKNSSVQALAQDAMTDVVFNIFSIIFPLIGYYANIWWLDPVGGIVLSLYVIINWSRTANEHIRNLTGASASADERNILLYLTMRFAKTIQKIQGLQAYHSGDKLNVEVDIVLDEEISLRDSHDLGESLQYVLESVPSVDRAFVHMDYADYNIPTHMFQDS
ncbi:Putative cation efflux protein [Septoria linicola]|uniref:Cation efflux protein n=1 Tax=Septoria linicola TaxID=215465 RepID=A0A9Q9AQM6_9PEZI|nr:Putative cation efflux protein [Septoria linicola]